MGERHAKTIIKTNIAKEVLKEVERAIMAQAGKKSGSTLKNMPHKLNMGQEDLLLFALNADAVAFGCQIWNRVATHTSTVYRSVCRISLPDVVGSTPARLTKTKT